MDDWVEDFDWDEDDDFEDDELIVGMTRSEYYQTRGYVVPVGGLYDIDRLLYGDDD